jgi:hypothetical protein
MLLTLSSRLYGTLFVVQTSRMPMVFCRTWIPSATALVTFSWYTLGEQEQLTVSKAFTAVALFSQLQEPMTALPGQFFALLHGLLCDTATGYVILIFYSLRIDAAY